MAYTNDKLKNFGIMIPQSFTTSFWSCVVHVHFEFKSKWEEFKLWIREGNLVKCQIDGSDIDVWVRRNTDLYGDSPASLQEHFNSFCLPAKNGYGFASYPLKTSGQ